MLKRRYLIVFFSCIFAQATLLSQDTFSIVAVDPETGEVGSAGASCVDLFQTGLPNDDFLGQLIPNVGAINTQAYYIPANQNNATTRMNAGDTPSQIIDWLTANDVQGQPQFRQYGIVAFVNGLPQTAGYTGTSTDNYKNHILGPNYAIQGNILLGQMVLDSMEARFLREEGDLACKLMAALQGANMVGADTRCSANGTSSLFAFVKVAKPTDTFGNPSFLVSVRTANNQGVEPITALQTKFDVEHNCLVSTTKTALNVDAFFKIFPNPVTDVLNLQSQIEGKYQVQVINILGKTVLQNTLHGNLQMTVSHLPKGSYVLKITKGEEIFVKKIIVK